eukprot:s233_g51.t1
MASDMGTAVEVEQHQPEMAGLSSTDSESAATLGASDASSNRASEDSQSSPSWEGGEGNPVTNHYHVHSDEFHFKNFHQHHSEMTVTYVHHHHHHYYFCPCSLRNGQACAQKRQNSRPEGGASGSVVVKDGVTARVGSCVGMRPEQLLENPMESPVRMCWRRESGCSSPAPKLRRLNASDFGTCGAKGVQ